MKILVVGGGGREHAIIKKLKENRDVTQIFALPGNGGIARDAVCVPVKPTDIDGIVHFAVGNQVDFAVVAPDDPLVLGAVNALQENGIPCFGPRSEAAIIEGSKVFAKQLMKKYGIPTAAYEVFSDAAAAIAYLQKNTKYPIVVKADGLALGKGVLICETRTEAVDAVESIMGDKIFGASGNEIVVEEFLTGPEVSVLAFTDGKTMVPMVSSMDHKRAHDGDTGLNTGGMGTVAPNPAYSKEMADRCMKTIFLPTMDAMNREGRTFKGCLYFGLMLTPDGPKVIEYNCRFGDPETQVVLPLLQTDLLTIMRAVESETLADVPVCFSDAHACCVVIASGGYPVEYKKGYPVSLGASASLRDTYVYHAGTALAEGRLVTAGGRVIGVTAVRDTLPAAIEAAYAGAREITFTDAFFRNDIGARALAEGGK